MGEVDANASAANNAASAIAATSAAADTSAAARASAAAILSATAVASATTDDEDEATAGPQLARGVSCRCTPRPLMLPPVRRV